MGAAGALLDGGRLELDLALRGEHEQRLAALREALGEASFAATLAEGEAMSLEEAVDLALGATGVPAGGARAPGARRTNDADGPAAGLTPRQLEVARLVAGGLSSREIAAGLSITERTAENHVEHILSRLGFRSRVQIATWAVEQGLVPGREAGPGPAGGDYSA